MYIVGLRFFGSYKNTDKKKILRAFSEGLIMRGVVQRYIFTKYPYVGIFMSAFLFQGMHYTTRVSDAMLYFTSGLVNAIIFYKTGRLELAMIIHAINNLVALILLSITL